MNYSLVFEKIRQANILIFVLFEKNFNEVFAFYLFLFSAVLLFLNIFAFGYKLSR